MKRRYIDVIQLLLAWAPLTAEDVFRGSQSFRSPFHSVKQCREELLAMHRARLLGRAPVPGTGPGEKPFAYYLRRGAGELVPEVRDVPKSNSVFQGISRNPWHSLAIGEFGTFFESHAARHEHIDLLERVRDRQFTADLSHVELARLIPDGTMLVQIGGRLKILFLELVAHTSIVNPGAEGTRARSLAGKLDKYRAFNPIRRAHPTWTLLEHAYGEIGGFQVLVVSTEIMAHRLAVAAEGTKTMFLFANLDEIRNSTDLFTDALWWIPRSPWRPAGPTLTSLSEH